MLALVEHALQLLLLLPKEVGDLILLLLFEQLRDLLLLVRDDGYRVQRHGVWHHRFRDHGLWQHWFRFQRHGHVTGAGVTILSQG